MNMRMVRRDTLPENARYQDEGCELADACLLCPLPICKEDSPGLNARLQRVDRNREIVKAHGKKGRRSAIAERFGVSARTVSRVVHQARTGYVSRRFEDTEGDADMTLEELAQSSRFRAPEPWPQLLRGEL